MNEFIEAGLNTLYLVANDIKSLVIKNKTDYESVEVTARQAKDFIKEAKAHFKPLKDSAHLTHKLICDEEKGVLQQAELIKAEALALMNLYDQKLQREAEAEQKKEQDRLDAERKLESDKLAADLIASGDVEAAKEQMQYQATAPAPVVEQRAVTTKTVGKSQTRKTYHFEILDRKLIPKEYWMIDEQAIKDHVKRNKDDADIEGVRFYFTEKKILVD